jgi:hypothetical protein
MLVPSFFIFQNISFENGSRSTALVRFPNKCRRPPWS